jgi:hypothetical protein
MCMADYSDGDSATFFSESTQKARKVHCCLECGREISKGETYRKYFGIYDGSPFGGKICQHCEVLAKWLSDNCGGYLYEAIVEDFTEHANEYQRMDIARLAVMARNSWRSVRKKTLLPIPRCPAPLREADAQVLLHS